MSNALLDAIQQGIEQGKPLIWLDADAFASWVVLKGKPIPWNHPTELVSQYRTLTSLLKPGVAPVQLGRFLADWLALNSGVLAEMRGKKRLRFALKKLLGMEGPRTVIRDIVSALGKSVPQPIALVLPPNGELINWANQAANGGEPVAVTDIDIDSVSVYLADFLRTFSGLEVAGVVVQLPPGTSVYSELLELYSPIINVAKHYHWAFGVQVTGAKVLDGHHEAIDFAISDHPSGNGGILDEAFWNAGEIGLNGKAFYFSRVPEALSPELVLERLQALR